MFGVAKRRTVVIFLILAVGFLLRAVQSRLGLPYVYNFDDPQVAAHALNIMKTGDLNPHFFAYGSLMIYLDTIVSAANYLRLAGLSSGQSESMMTYDQINMINSIVAPMDGTPVWSWTISHPSFYLWDRYVTAIFGTLTIATTYAMSRRFIEGAMAFLPPMLLAILPIHIIHSGLTTTDVPVAFMVGAATLAALTFAETGGLTAFLTSLLCVGLAAATKYNSGLILISPLVALMLRLSDKQGSVYWWHWAFLIAVPAITFLTVMPFAVLDFKRFITDLAQSVSSYHATGPARAKPGMRHLGLILRQFEDNIGLVGALLGVVGLGRLIVAQRSRKALLILVAFPVLFVLYMSTTTPDYHRNFVQLYPFICLYIGYGIFQISRLFAGLQVRLLRIEASVLVAVLLAAIVILPMLYYSTANATDVATRSDTRTQAILRANSLKNIGQIEISGDLHIHALDINRLNYPRVEVGMDEIAHDICAASSLGGRTFILPSEIRNTDFLGGTPDRNAEIQRFNVLLHALRQLPATILIGNDVATPSWGPPASPRVMIVQSHNGFCDTLKLAS